MPQARQPGMFYIREVRNGGFHRVGCVVMKRVNATHFKVGWSLCNKADRFNPKAAKLIAELKLDHGSYIIPIRSDSQGVYFADLVADLGIADLIKKNGYAVMDKGAYTKNMHACGGAISECTHKPRKAAKV